MKRPQLTTEKRELLGKKVKKLRKEGLLPAHVYGKDIESQAIQLKLTDFQDAYKEVGETGVLDLVVDGKKIPVLIKNLQLRYPLQTPLHVDFYQVNLKEKVKATVPVVVTGEPVAVTEKIGLLLQTLSEVEVEALPDKLPENIEVPVEHLAELNQQITVADLKAPEGVEILTDPTQVVAKIVEPVSEEPEPEEPKEGEEGAEGEEAAEGEEKDGEEKEAASTESSGESKEGEKKESGEEKSAEEKKEE